MPIVVIVIGNLWLHCQGVQLSFAPNRQCWHDMSDLFPSRWLICDLLLMPFHFRDRWRESLADRPRLPSPGCSDEDYDDDEDEEGEQVLGREGLSEDDHVYQSLDRKGRSRSGTTDDVYAKPLKQVRNIRFFLNQGIKKRNTKKDSSCSLSLSMCCVFQYYLSISFGQFVMCFILAVIDLSCTMLMQRPFEFPSQPYGSLRWSCSVTFASLILGWLQQCLLKLARIWTEVITMETPRLPQNVSHTNVMI